MTVGDIDTARMLYRYFGDDYYTDKRAPKGFNRIGAGCYRTAYLERATQTVYKLGDSECNTYEAYMSRRLRRKSTRSLGFELRIPQTRTYTMEVCRTRWERKCVTAQEYAIGARYTDCASQDDWMEVVPDCNCKSNICYATVHDIVRSWSGLSDVHSGNVLVDKNKVFWLVDMGC